MILADTSVWIEFFRPYSSSTVSETLEILIRENNQICICGIVLQEILQGIKEEKAFNLVKSRLLIFPYIEANLETHLIAALFYRKLRQKGILVPTIDLLISALAIQNNLFVFTLDKHFKDLEKYTGLKLTNFTL